MTEITPFCFVTNFLTLKDMCLVESTCKYLKYDMDIWNYFFHYHKNKMNEYDKLHLEHLKTVFYDDCRRAIKSYYVRKIWENFSLQDQTQCLTVPKIIKLYLISAWARYGKDVVQQMVYRLNKETTGGSYIRWLVPCHSILNGKTNKFFRRNYLPVY